MKQRIIPAIMSGGAGARLWPLSTDNAPKQFHPLASAKSLFAETAARLTGETAAAAFANPIVLSNVNQGRAVRAALTEAGLKPAAIVLEPAKRNTAAVAAVAAAFTAEIDPEALVLLAPADHLVTRIAEFHAAVDRAVPFARERIVTFGITPDRPATGYGYIKRGAELGEGVFAVEAFREKPDEATAAMYLAAGGYSWNSGMFLFDPSTALSAFDASPEIRKCALEALAEAHRDGPEVRLGDTFTQAPEEPFDTAVMEKTTKAAVVPCDIGWADIGSWDEIWRLSEKDASGNVIGGDVVAQNSTDSLLRAEGVKLCVAGISDLIIVATRDAVIVLPRAEAQAVKSLKEAAQGD